MVTLRDIAAASGVHVTTVSSVLNGAGGNTRVSEATRQRVTEAAERLGYSRNLIAHSLRTRKTGTVGFVAGNLQNPFFAELASKLESRLQHHGYSLVMTCHGADSAADEDDLVKTLLDRSVDGLLIWSELRGGRSARLSKGEHTPRVWLGLAPKGETAVTFRISEGLQLAVDHLKGLGARRLGFFGPVHALQTGLPKPRPDLLDGICKGSGLRPATRLLFDGESWDLATATAEAQSKRFRELSREVDAVIGYNDVCALAWWLSCIQNSATPRVVGFDGSPLVRGLATALPYVDLHGAELAAAAADLLVERIANPALKARRFTVAPTFVGA